MQPRTFKTALTILGLAVSGPFHVLQSSSGRLGGACAFWLGGKELDMHHGSSIGSRTLTPTGAVAFGLAQRTAEARRVRDPGLRGRGLGWCVVGFLMCGASGAWASGGVVALQTADASCPDDSGNIYVDCGNGTVTDNRTGLVWLANANCVDIVTWYEAMEFVAGLSDKPATSAAAAHDCGLSDGSSPGEWRLPSVEEWEAMVADALGEGPFDPDCTVTPPTITNDSGAFCWVNGPGPESFSGVQSSFYWSSTTDVLDSDPTEAWYMHLGNGNVHDETKFSSNFVWPVRGGQ